MDYNFKVKKSEKGKRLDSFLHEKLETWSHRQIKNAIDRKRVLVNGKNVFISGWNLKAGDRISFNPAKDDMPQAPELSRYQFINVIYDDKDILVTDKPAFVDYDSFVAQVNAFLKRQSHKDKFYPYLGQMHRLDKETSGLLIFTKKKSANVLADQFRDHRILKYYLVLVEGAVDKDHDIIRDAIEKGKFEGGQKAKIADEGEGKESYTEYWVKERYAGATLLRVQIKTGRTHQIRIHLSSRGYPVLGDKLYKKEERPKGKDQNPETKNQKIKKIEPLKVKRQMLHAQQIEFRHPITHKKIKCESPIPKDMAALIERLRESV